MVNLRSSLIFLSSLHLTLASIPSIPGFHVIWYDDFNGKAGTEPSITNWIIDTGTSYPGGPAQWGTGEVETYTSSSKNLQQTGKGQLYITPVHDASKNTWTSARIETRNSSFSPAAGKIMRVQASIALPNVTSTNGLGYWPAFWMLGHAFRSNYSSWPGVGEVDIMENVNGGNVIYETLHCGTDPYGPCNEPDGLGSAQTCSSTKCQNGYRTFTLEIDRTLANEQMRWYVNGVLGKTLTKSQLGDATWEKTVDQGFFILLNVAVGGALPNAIAGITTPNAKTVSGRSMAVDYVGVWES